MLTIFYIFLGMKYIIIYTTQYVYLLEPNNMHTFTRSRNKPSSQKMDAREP